MNKKYAIAAVIATAFLALVTVLGIGLQTAKGYPSYQSDCSSCHGTSGVYPNAVTAVPSASSVAPGGAYQVNISMSTPVNGATGTGYWIANSTSTGTTGSSTGVYAGGPGMGTTGKWTASMTAPTTPGTYYYKVFGQSGPTGSGGLPGYALYSITVASASTPTATATRTTVPPTATATRTTVPPTATSTSVPATPTQTRVPPTPTNTSVPPTATNTAVPPTATNTAVPPTATSTVVPIGTTVPAPRGQQLYEKYCAYCHEPSSVGGFVGETVYGASPHDITEALDKVSEMAGLDSLLSYKDIKDISAYLRSLGSRGGKEEAESHD